VAAISAIAGRTHEPQKYDQRSIQPKQILIAEATDASIELRLWDGGNLVHHQATIGLKAILLGALDKYPEQRSISRVRCEWTDGD
jgi:hypothetical protein